MWQWTERAMLYYFYSLTLTGGSVNVFYSIFATLLGQSKGLALAQSNLRIAL